MISSVPLLLAMAVGAPDSWLEQMLRLSPFVVLVLFWLLIPAALVALAVILVRRFRPSARPS